MPLHSHPGWLPLSERFRGQKSRFRHAGEVLSRDRAVKVFKGSISSTGKSVPRAESPIPRTRIGIRMPCALRPIGPRPNRRLKWHVWAVPKDDAIGEPMAIAWLDYWCMLHPPATGPVVQQLIGIEFQDHPVCRIAYGVNAGLRPFISLPIALPLFARGHGKPCACGIGVGLRSNAPLEPNAPSGRTSRNATRTGPLQWAHFHAKSKNLRGHRRPCN